MIHLMNWGMGVESTAILVRWMLEPETRPFDDWKDLIVLVAQTGDEYPETKELCEKFILPMFRERGIYLVQVGRRSLNDADGIVVLDDSTEPHELFINDPEMFAMGQSMELDGYVPRLGRPHICAQRWKGWVLDNWIRANINPNVQIGPYLGYNLDEVNRKTTSDDYGCYGAHYRYPLIDDWKWTRQDCIDYLYKCFGVIWHKSCCVHCPFQGPVNAIEHWRTNPEAGATTLYREYLAMALNYRMALFGLKKATKKLPERLITAYKTCIDAGLNETINLFQQQLDMSDWAIYRVRRIYNNYGKLINADREVLSMGSIGCFDINSLARFGQPVKDEAHNIYRVWTHRRQEPKVYPDLEAFYVLAPAGIRNKVRSSKSFSAKWEAVSNPQLTLF